ncbi:MAG TPA: neutral zinc metallopeptidase [Actinomycetota bacterium]|nr:neutral zinc metallopeptidase [Actinomycetota bacterium]
MRWKRGPRSGDLVDRRGRSGLGRGGAIAGGLSLPVLVVVVLVNLLGGGGDIGGGLDDLGGAPEAAQGAPPSAEDEKLVDFMSFVLDDVQNFWEDTFRQADIEYRRAKLVLFTGSTNSQCGGATSDIGPHYCPPDENIYLDLEFFRELKRQFGAPGDFAQAYVLAHEVAHHVQNLLGINEEVRARSAEDPSVANDLSVRLELQADCFAGVWAFTTYERDLLQRGDLQEGLDAAAAVGDDRIQEKATGRIDPESWTHGSSEMRMRWFSAGYEDGDPNACDTFEADSL